MKKILFWGSPDFTTDFLKTLSENDMRPSAIVTQPDKPFGRGMNIKKPAPKIWAEENGIRVFQPQKIDEKFYNQLSREEWDLSVVVAYGKILSEKIIDLPKYGTINVHYSLLPKYRGATPIESAILNGEISTGVTIQQMRYELDTGDVLSKKEVFLEESDSKEDLRDRLTQEALSLLIETCRKIFNQSLSPVAQDESKATYCSKITKSDGEINVDDDPVKNYRKYKAYYGWPGTFFFANRQDKTMRIKIKKAQLKDGQFKIDEVVPENHNKMTFDQYLNWLNS